MEMFDPQYAASRKEIDGEREMQKYSPKCSPAELNKMIDFNAYKARNKLKFMHIESKVSQHKNTQSSSTLQTNLEALRPTQRIETSNSMLLASPHIFNSISP